MSTPLADSEYIEISELLELQRAGEPAVVVDARSDRTFNDSELLAQGAVRIAPDHAVLKVEKHHLPKSAVLAVFCA
jgi:hypothetical protein